MTSRTRSMVGLLTMLALLPIFAGLLACVPEYVPLGNPERARIDPEMTDVWFVSSDNELIGSLIILQPWDKRTWLVMNVMVEATAEADLGDLGAATYDGFFDLLAQPDVSAEDLHIGVITYKGWLAKLGGERFMTWEIRGALETSEKQRLLDPWFWQDVRVSSIGENEMVLHLIDTAFEPLAEADKTKRAWERVIRKHAKNDELYYDEPAVLQRVRQDDRKAAADLVNQGLLGKL